MKHYTYIFDIALICYLFLSLALISKPIRAVGLYLAFVSLFQPASYLKFKSYFGLPFFAPVMLMLFLHCCRAAFVARHGFNLNKPILLYCGFVFSMAWICVIHAVSGTGSAGFYGGSYALEEIIKTAFPIIVYAVVYFGIQDRSDLKSCCATIFAVITIPAILGTIGYFADFGYNADMDSFGKVETPQATLCDRNLYGIFLALCLCFAIPLVQSSSILLKLNIANGIIALVVSQNRGTWICLTIAMFISLMYFKHRANMFRYVLIFVLVLLVSLPIAISRFDQLSQRDQYGQSQNTAEGRLSHSVGLLKKVMKNPFIGSGPGAFAINDAAATSTKAVLPHNDYMRIAVEFGIPMVILYFFFIKSAVALSLSQRYSDLWNYQLGALWLFVYFMLISVAQNILTNTLSFPLILAMLAVSVRARELSSVGRAP